jgi:hypothetical protein
VPTDVEVDAADSASDATDVEMRVGDAGIGIPGISPNPDPDPAVDGPAEFKLNPLGNDGTGGASPFIPFSLVSFDSFPLKLFNQLPPGVFTVGVFAATSAGGMDTFKLSPAPFVLETPLALPFPPALPPVELEPEVDATIPLAPTPVLVFATADGITGVAGNGTVAG